MPSDPERQTLDLVKDLGLPPPAPIGIPATIGLTSAPTLPLAKPQPESDAMPYWGAGILLVFGVAVLWYVLRKSSEDSGLSEHIESLAEKLNVSVERTAENGKRIGTALEAVSEHNHRLGVALENMDLFSKQMVELLSRLESLEGRLAELEKAEQPVIEIVEKKPAKPRKKPRNGA